MRATGFRDLPQIAAVFHYFAPRIRPHVGALVAALGLGIVVALSELARPWPIQLIFDHLLMAQDGAPRPLGIDLRVLSLPQAIGAAALAVVAVSVVGGLAAYGETLLLSGTGQRVVAKVRRDLFRHLLRLPVGFHTRRRSGDLLMRLTGDIILLRELMVAGMLDGVASLLVLTGTLAVMFWLDWRLTLVTLTVAPLITLAGSVFARKIRHAVRRSRNKEGAMSAGAGEALAAIQVLQAFGAEEDQSDRFAKHNRSGLRAGLRAARAEALLSRTLDLLTASGTGLVLAVGTWSVLQGALTPGGLLVFLAYQRSLYRPIRRIARTVTRAAKASACGERVMEILKTAPQIAEAPDAKPCPPLGGAISLQHVTVRYPRGDVALDDIHVEIPAGATVLVRGPSGAGKSTLASLLPRLLDPTEGRVLIDGHDIRSVTLATLRRQIALVFQESVLLGFSLRENIALGDGSATEQEIADAAHRAGVLAFADGLSEGLDTVVGERGAELSGGQRQRVAIARALLRKAPILVLDEPFLHLDDVSRRRFITTLRDQAGAKTMLLVTHDDDAGIDHDLEIKLDRGRLVDVVAQARLQRVTS